MSSMLINGQIITTLLGSNITVTINSNGVFIDNAQVIIADLLMIMELCMLLMLFYYHLSAVLIVACNYDPSANTDDGSCLTVTVVPIQQRLVRSTATCGRRLYSNCIWLHRPNSD